MASQNHTLNMFERDELIEIIEDFYSAVDHTDVYDDLYRNALEILGVYQDTGEDDDIYVNGPLDEETES